MAEPDQAGSSQMTRLRLCLFLLLWVYSVRCTIKLEHFYIEQQRFFFLGQLSSIWDELRKGCSGLGTYYVKQLKTAPALFFFVINVQCFKNEKNMGSQKACATFSEGMAGLLRRRLR